MKARKKNTTIMFMFGMVVFILLTAMFPNYDNKIYEINYLIDLICLVVLFWIYLVGYLLNKYDFLSPITFFSALFFFMFYVAPIYDLLTEEILWFNVDLFSYGIKGSLYAFLGYLCFYVAYVLSFKNKADDFTATINYSYVNDDRSNYRLKALIIAGYAICLLASIFYVVKTGGQSLLYIFTLGLFGKGNTGDVTNNLGFVIMLSYCLTSFTLLYCEYGNSKFLKVLFFILMFQIHVVRGFRFIIIQIAITFVFYWILSKNSHLKKSLVISFLLLVLASIIIMTMFRNAIRDGDGVDVEKLSLEPIKTALDDAFWDNLRIYKNYYALIKVVPEETPYMYGKQMFVYTIIMLIPRAIWTNKPENPGTTAIGVALGTVAVKGGTAYPCLGEYYYEFGLVGIIVFLTIFGLWMKKSEYRFRFCNRGKIDLMKYCTLVGLILQIVIRGYTPSNFWLVVFSLIPYWIAEHYVKSNPAYSFNSSKWNNNWKGD